MNERRPSRPSRSPSRDGKPNRGQDSRSERSSGHRRDGDKPRGQRSADRTETDRRDSPKKRYEYRPPARDENKSRSSDSRPAGRAPIRPEGDRLKRVVEHGDREPEGFGGYLNIAVRAAMDAGRYILRETDRLDRIRISEKQPNDFVTEVDRQAEAIIIDTLSEYFPEHGFLGEESGSTGNPNGDSDFQWIIDPLDGTTNFIHGNPNWCVSIALQYRGELTVGIVYDAPRDEIFTALKGSGCQLNGHKIRVSKARELQQALVGTGIPFRKVGETNLEDQLDDYLGKFRAVVENTAGIRRPGAAALDLAWVAAGRLDGFWESGLKPWDVAAGGLLVKEAGGMVSDLKGKQGWLESGNILAAAPRIHLGLAELLIKA